MLRRMIVLAGLVVLLLSITPALAGGWVVVTVENLPLEIKAGEPVEFDFMVRQHGHTPTHDVFPVLLAVNTLTGEQIQSEAEKAQEIGRYKVSFNFPQAGQWEWAISTEPFPQTMTLAPINVLAKEGAAVTDSPTQASDSLSKPMASYLRWSGLSLLVAATILVTFGQRRQAMVALVSGD